MQDYVPGIGDRVKFFGSWGIITGIPFPDRIDVRPIEHSGGSVGIPLHWVERAFSNKTNFWMQGWLRLLHRMDCSLEPKTTSFGYIKGRVARKFVLAEHRFNGKLDKNFEDYLASFKSPWTTYTFLKTLCELLMCSDPWPSSPESETEIKHKADVMARNLGFSDRAVNANKIIDSILRELKDRKGFGHWWDNIPEEDQIEIEQDLAQIVENALRCPEA